MFFFLALRNIFKNKKNSAALILFISVITFLFFTGNSIIGRAGQSLRGAYIDSLTGDVVLQKSGPVTMNLFGANTPIIDSYFTIPVFPAYDTVMRLVEEEPGIENIAGQVSGRAYLSCNSVNDPVLLCGVDADKYFPLFPGIILEEGRFLKSGEYGAMMTLDHTRQIEEKSGQKVEIGMPLLFTNAGSVGFKIREVNLTGIFTYKNPGQYMNDIIIIDAQTVRVLNSIQVADSGGIEPGSEILGMFSADTDDLFGDLFSAAAQTGEYYDEGFSADLLYAILNEDSGPAVNPETGGDWNFIIIKLKKGVSANAFISRINKKLSPYNITAVNWRTAAGTSAILMLLVQALFNAGIFLVGIAVVFAAVNILLISVFRRTREIGTLRAIGASGVYIRLLIISENLVLSFLAALIGLLAGFVFFRFVNNLELHIGNELIASLLGGSVLKLDFLPGMALLSVMAALVLGFAASVYPVETAVRIQPMAALRRG